MVAQGEPAVPWRMAEGAHKYLWHQVCFCLPAAVPKGWSIVRSQPVLPSSLSLGQSGREALMTFPVVASCLLHAIAQLFSKQIWAFRAQARTEMLLKPRGKYTPSSCTRSIYTCYRVFSILDIAFSTDGQKKPKQNKNPKTWLIYPSIIWVFIN